jgi:hypothetical protein
MCAVRSLVSLAALGLRGFFAVIKRRGAWRLPFFLFLAGASESGAVRFVFSVDIFFFATGVQ